MDKSTGRVQDQWTYRYMNHSAVNVRSSRRGGVLFSMSYDSVGNLLSKEDHNLVGGYRQEMVYDSYNRIQSVSRAQRLVGEYRYDAQGFRVRKRSRRTVFEIDTSLGQANERLITAERWYELEYHNKYFAVERQKNMDGEIIPNTEHSINNVYLEGVRVAAIEPSGAARYFLTDQVDSVKLVADSDGKIVSRTEYYPYGEKWFAERTEDIAPKYNGQELDKESDFYYFNARHYDPELARFVTPDVVVDGERRDDETGLIVESPTYGWNRYMYVAGNPITYKDPTGHKVTGVYNKKTGNLVIKDDDTGEEIKIKAESGGKPYGDAIPTGKYKILERSGEGGEKRYRLEALDENFGDDKHESVNRDKFRLHGPPRTTGCIQCDEKDIEKVDKLLQKTKTGEVEVDAGHHLLRKLKDIFGVEQDKETVKDFGTLEVIDGETSKK